VKPYLPITTEDRTQDLPLRPLDGCCPVCWHLATAVPGWGRWCARHGYNYVNGVR
jgi:hypothetical protein